ncbi:MAG: lipopolysaccharide transport periplasmic protein LptA [Lautropia sp.]
MKAAALIASLALGFGCAPAMAERADRDKPTNIEADRAQYDDAKKVTVFTGNVVLTKGTIMIRGDRVILRQFENNTQSAVATGRRASFRQKREGLDQFINGMANEIDYDSRTEILRLTGDAMIRRLECEAPIDEITGAVVVYNARTEMFTVDGKDAASGSGGRVRIVIQPRNDGKTGDGKPGETAPGGAVKCPPGAALPLKPAAALELPRAPGAQTAR